MKVEIKGKSDGRALHGKGIQVLLDDVDISDSLCGFKLDSRVDDVVSVELKLFPSEVVVDADIEDVEWKKEGK